MISPSRIVHIFRHKGGSGQFTKTADELTDEELASVRESLDGEKPLVISVRSKEDWFVLTGSRLVLTNGDGVSSTALRDIDGFSHSGIRELARGKLEGGKLEIRSKDGLLFNLRAESGRPFLSLLNIFIYLEKVNRKPRIATSRAGSTTTTTCDGGIRLKANS